MNIQLPDSTPMIDIIKFAASQGLSIRYCRGGNLNLVPKEMAIPEGVRNVVRIDAKRKA